MFFHESFVAVTYVLDVYGSQCKTNFLLWVKVTNLKAPPWRGVGHAANTPQTGMLCLLLESLLGGGWVEGEKGYSRSWQVGQQGLAEGPL